MAIEFMCPKCGQALELDDALGGTQSVCPACGESIAVPAAPASAGATEASSLPAQEVLSDEDLRAAASVQVTPKFPVAYMVSDRADVGAGPGRRLGMLFVSPEEIMLRDIGPAADGTPGAIAVGAAAGGVLGAVVAEVVTAGVRGAVWAASDHRPGYVFDRETLQVLCDFDKGFVSLSLPDGRWVSMQAAAGRPYRLATPVEFRKFAGELQRLLGRRLTQANLGHADRRQINAMILVGVLLAAALFIILMLLTSRSH